MTEEEKKALKVINARTRRLLDELEIEKEDMSDDPKIAYLMQEIRANKTLLNLIEKLLKENEELKEYIAIAPNLDEMTAIKYRNIQQDAYIRGRAEEQKKAGQIIYENYIPIQKIKDKIEELNREIDKSIDNSKGGLDEEFIEKAGKLLAQKRILQELLERRK